MALVAAHVKKKHRAAATRTIASFLERKIRDV